jgi:hypothetical protein
MKTLLVIILPFVLSACVSCAAETRHNVWPNLSFVVIDQLPDKHVFERTKDFNPTVKRVILLPIVENYLWNGKRHHFALADPIIVEPGGETLQKIMAPFETGDQAVRSCIILARDYCPGTLQPVINYAGSYKGKEVWLVELARLSSDQYKGALESIINELSSGSIQVGKEKIFESAVKEGKLLSTGELLSPIVRNDGFRFRYVLWNMPPDTKVPICMSSAGLNVIKKELDLNN